MFNFQGLSSQKTVENFDVKALAASRIKLSENAKNVIGLTDDKGVFLDKDVTSNNFWIASVAEGGKKLTKTNTFGHKVLNDALGEGSEWKIDITGAKEFNGITYFPLTLSAAPAPKEIEETPEANGDFAQSNESEVDVAYDNVVETTENVVGHSENALEDLAEVTQPQSNGHFAG